jgi:hypothetical protein
MPLSRKEQPRYLIIMGIDIRKCQFAPNTACTRLPIRCEFQGYFRVVIIFRGASAVRRTLGSG